MTLSSALLLTITAFLAKARHQGSTGLYTGRRSLACVDRVDGVPVIGSSILFVKGLNVIEKVVYGWSLTIAVMKGLWYLGRLVEIAGVLVGVRLDTAVLKKVMD